MKQDSFRKESLRLSEIKDWVNRCTEVQSAFSVIGLTLPCWRIIGAQPNLNDQHTGSVNNMDGKLIAFLSTLVVSE